jgi:hypothetical protein
MARDKVKQVRNAFSPWRKNAEQISSIQRQCRAVTGASGRKLQDAGKYAIKLRGAKCGALDAANELHNLISFAGRPPLPQASRGASDFAAEAAFHVASGFP